MGVAVKPDLMALPETPLGLLGILPDSVAAEKKGGLYIPLVQAAGRTAAEYVWAYPPGVPLLAPGEEVTPDFVAAAAALAASGTRLRHTGCKNSAMVRVAT